MTNAELIAILKTRHPDAEIWVVAEGEDGRPLAGADLSDDMLFSFLYTK